MKDEVAQALSDNYNLAEFIRDRLIPRAVLFFTGEAAEEEEEDEVHNYVTIDTCTGFHTEVGSLQDPPPSKLL